MKSLKTQSLLFRSIIRMSRPQRRETMLQSSSLSVPRRVLSYFWRSKPFNVPHMTQRGNRVALVLFVVVFLAAVPLSAFAQLPGEIVPCKGVDCSVCDVATLAQNVLNAGIY